MWLPEVMALGTEMRELVEPGQSAHVPHSWRHTLTDAYSTSGFQILHNMVAQLHHCSACGMLSLTGD